mmetsp:Transcript_82569/g.96561  ORF Transcript_82569/g.96561 Transcript_82569/m.96561 type:complete len:84 (-) Transcript_82569:79-330(-)
MVEAEAGSTPQPQSPLPPQSVGFFAHTPPPHPPPETSHVFQVSPNPMTITGRGSVNNETIHIDAGYGMPFTVVGHTSRPFATE